MGRFWSIIVSIIFVSKQRYPFYVGSPFSSYFCTNTKVNKVSEFFGACGAVCLDIGGSNAPPQHENRFRLYNNGSSKCRLTVFLES